VLVCNAFRPCSCAHAVRLPVAESLAIRYRCLRKIVIPDFSDFGRTRARPCGVPAAMAETSLVTHKYLTRAEGVPVRATRRRVGDPLPGRRLHQLGQHKYKPMPQTARSSVRHPWGSQ